MARPRKWRQKRDPQKPFRGPTPPKVFQTVDIGSGSGDYILRQAKKFPNRKYAVTDPIYNPPYKMRLQSPTLIRETQHAANKLRDQGVKVYPHRLAKVIKIMKMNGYKTRNFNIDMPLPFNAVKSYNFEKLFKEAPNVLLPNGKIFISTEYKALLSSVVSIARQYGLRTRNLATLQLKDIGGRSKTKDMQTRIPIFRLEITFVPHKFEATKKRREKSKAS